MSAFEGVMRNFLYRKASNDKFSIKTLLEKAMEDYPDLWTKIRASSKTGNIKDLFVAFRNRVEECKYMILL